MSARVISPARQNGGDRLRFIARGEPFDNRRGALPIDRGKRQKLFLIRHVLVFIDDLFGFFNQLVEIKITVIEKPRFDRIEPVIFGAFFDEAVVMAFDDFGDFRFGRENVEKPREQLRIFLADLKQAFDGSL